MKGSQIASSLPAGPGSEREQALFDAVRRRDIPFINWTPIKTTYGPYTATIYVSNDGLRIGDESDSFRATVSQRNAQRIADDLNVVIPTTKISDMIYKHAAHKLMPITRPWYADAPGGGGTMSLTHRMLQQSASVDKAIAGRKGLIADVGKDWVITRRLWDRMKSHPGGRVMSAIYGWRGGGATGTPAGPGADAVIQPLALAHPVDHVDYSQVMRLVGRHVYLCSDEIGGCGMVDIEKILSDPKTAPLISYEGALPVYRHPGLPGAGDQPPLPPPPGPKPTPPPPVPPPRPGPGPAPGPGPSTPTPGLEAVASTEAGDLVVFGAAAVVGFWAVSQFVKSDR